MRPEDVNAVMAIWLQGNLQAHPFVAPSYWMDNMQGVGTALLVRAKERHDRLSLHVYIGKTLWRWIFIIMLRFAPRPREWMEIQVRRSSG